MFFDKILKISKMLPLVDASCITCQLSEFIFTVQRPFMLCDRPIVCNAPSCVHQKSAEEDVSGRTLAWEPGRLTLTLFGIRSIEQLLPFFTVLSQVFSSKSGIRSASFHSNALPGDVQNAPKNNKHESQKTFWSRARHDIEEMVEKDFLEGLIKT